MYLLKNLSMPLLPKLFPSTEKSITWWHQPVSLRTLKPLTTQSIEFESSGVLTWMEHTCLQLPLQNTWWSVRLQEAWCLLAVCPVPLSMFHNLKRRTTRPRLLSDISLHPWLSNGLTLAFESTASPLDICWLHCKIWAPERPRGGLFFLSCKPMLIMETIEPRRFWMKTQNWRSNGLPLFPRVRWVSPKILWAPSLSSHQTHLTTLLEVRTFFSAKPLWVNLLTPSQPIYE